MFGNNFSGQEVITNEKKEDRFLFIKFSSNGVTC